MKQLILICALAVSFPFVSLAQELPTKMQEILASSKEGYREYALKSPAEILDHQYDQSEVMLLSRLHLGDGLAVIFPKETIVRFRLETVKNLAEVFSAEQLSACSQMAQFVSQSGRSSPYFDRAAELKAGKISESKLLKLLSKKPFEN